MATEADISDLISPMKIEAEDKEHNSGIVKKELIEVNEGIVKSIEGENFLLSPSFIDGKEERNTEDNQLNSIRKMNGSQNGDKIDMKTDENNSKPASEPTDSSQGTTFDIEKVSDVCPLKEKRDDTLTAEAILSQQDSTETSFKDEDGSQNKSSESPLTEKVDNIEVSKQELAHEAMDKVEDNLNDKWEALGNVEMLVTEASEEIETTPPSETPDQIPAKENVTTISGDINVLATPEEKNQATIDLDEENGETKVALIDKSGDDSNATFPLVKEVQITSEMLNQAPIVATEGQALEVSEGSEGEQEGNSSNEVIQTAKHFDKNADDQIIKEKDIEAEDNEHNSGNSKVVKEELIEVNESIVESIEGEIFLQSPSFIDGEMERNTEDSQLNSISEMNGSQNGNKIELKTDENNSKPASESTNCSEHVSDVCPLEEKRDDTLTAEAILSQQDSTESSLKEEDDGDNKSSKSPLTEIDNIEISKQELDHEARDIVKDNLNDEPEALATVEMLVVESSEEIETTVPGETPDQNPVKEDVTTISGDIKVLATPDEKNHAAIDLDERNEEAEVAVTDNSGDDTNATSPLVVDEEKQIISEKLNQVLTVETEGQGLKVTEGSKGEQEDNSSNEVIQTTKHFDKNADDQIIKEEEFEEPKVTNEREKIEEDINKETLTVSAMKCNSEDVTSGIRENITVANISDEEEPEEPSMLEETENKIENDTEKSENVSSLVSQAVKEEVYEAKMEDTKNYVEKADTTPPRILETTNLTEVEPFDKPLEETLMVKAHLREHEIESEDLKRAENPNAQSESHVQDVYEITRGPNVEESGANEIEKIIREVPEELSEADNNGENGESETKTQVEDKIGLEDSDAVLESEDQNIEEIYETKTNVSAEKNEVSENNEAETSKPTKKPDFHGIAETKENQAPIAEQIPTEEEKEELNTVPETGNSVDEIENETTTKTETELINLDADENNEEKLSEVTFEPNAQCVEGIDEIEPKPPVSETQAGKETEETKDVPEAVFEHTVQNVEEVSETSSKAGHVEKLNQEALEAFSEPTNQVVEAVNNDDIVTPTVAIALTSSNEFHLNGEAENVNDTVSGEKNIETTGKADCSQQDEGVEKIIPEDASTSVSDYAHEDVKKESESAEIDEEIGEDRTPITIYEYNDQVVEDARETDLSSAVDERNICEIAKVEKDVTVELPEAINEDVEAESKDIPGQEITKSDTEDVQEAKASVPVIQSKALSIEEMDGFDPTHSNFQGVGTINDEEVVPNQTLLIESKEQLTEPCSTLVEDLHHETTTEEEMVKAESVNKNDTLLNEDTADLLETGYEVQMELDISNSDVTVQESQNEATEKEIDDENINKKMKCDEGESKLINDQINAFGTSTETTIPETIETVDTTKQDSEADGTKIQETSNVESQFLSRENETEACESTTAENEDAENLEAENSKDHNVEEIHETDTSPALGDTETSEIDHKVREAPRVINQVYEADSSDEIAHGQKIQAKNLEAFEAFSEPTNQVVKEVSNDDFTAPTVATELTSSKEFQLGGAPENVTNLSAENVETTKKADSSQQDEGIEKIVLEDASTAVSDYVQEDEEKDSESSKVDEVGEAKTAVTISEHKDKVVEHARVTDLSSTVDESNVNEIANVEKEIPRELPEAINEVVEASSKIDPNQSTAENEEACGSNNHSFEETREMKTGQNLENYKTGEENIEAQPSESIKLPNVIGLEEISEPEPTPLAREIYEDEKKEEVDGKESEAMNKNETGAIQSDADEIQEAKASEPVIQPKAIYVEGTDELDLEPTIGKMPTNEEREEIEAVSAFNDDFSPNQTLPVESKEQPTEPCSVSVKDQHHETVTEVEIVKPECTNKNDVWLNKDTADLLKTGTTETVVQKELEISNSDVRVQDTQMEKEIDEESIEEKMERDEGADIAATTGTGVTLVRESKLINEPINAFGTSSETTTPETIETFDTSDVCEISTVDSQLLAHDKETEVYESFTAETDAVNLEVEKSEVPSAKSDILIHNVGEIHETNTSLSVEDTYTSEVRKAVREVPEVINQVYEADSSDEIALGQRIQAENRKAPEAFSEPTNQVEEVSNGDFVAPTVATELTSSKEFPLDGAPENVTNSSAENIETTEKADSSQQDEVIVKIVPEDASAAVSGYVQEDEEKYIDEEVEEVSTTDTIFEHKDQVVGVARETGLSSAVDESNINEIAEVKKEVSEELPDAVNEDAEADSKITLDQEITENEEVCGSNDQSFEETREMKTKPNSEITETSESIIEPNVIGLEKISETEPTPTTGEIQADDEKDEVTNKIETGVNRSDAEEIQEAKASEPITLPKVICVEETDELDPTSAIGKMPTNEEREETEAVPAVTENVNEDISPNQTLPIESKEQLTEPHSVSVGDQHHETVTEVEILKPESINKNDTWLNEDTTDLPETGTTETVVQKDLEISNSNVTVQDTQNGETQKAIDEENIEEKMKCDDGADTSATTGTEVTLVRESELINEPINTFGTGSETTTPGTIVTIDTSEVCESSTVDSQLLAHENETEVCDSFTAETDSENVEVEKSEVPAAESEFLVHNVEEIHQTDTSPAVEDTYTSEVEKAVREVPGVINQVNEADSSDEISHDRKIQAENTVDSVQVPSFVFLPSEESHESKAITMDNTEDGHMKKDDTEENNLKPLEVTGVDTVKAEETLDVETVTDDEAIERPLVIGGLEEERQDSSSALMSEKQDEPEESKISETKTETNVLGVEEVYEDETSTVVEETHADKVEEETKEALETIHDPKCQDIGVITDRESVSNQTFPSEITKSAIDGVEDTDIAPTPASEVSRIEEIELSDEAAKDFDTSSESKAPETIEVEGIKPEEASIVEVTRAVHENKEAHESVTAEKTDPDDIEVENQKVLDAESEYVSVEEINGAKANPVVGETDTDESEKVVREVPKALPEGNNQGPEADSNAEIIPSWTSQAENIEEEVSKSPPIFLFSEESQENVATTTTEHTEDEREKVTQDVLRALPEGINQGPEAVSNDQIPSSCSSQAENIEEEVSNSSSVFFLSGEKSHETSTKNTDDDSLKLQETFGMLSQLQTIETKEASVADEVEAEEAKGSDAIYGSKDHLDDIHETKSSPSAEISNEVNMEEATSNEAEKISDVEAIDVPTDESTSVSNRPTENLDIGANITNPADDKPEEVIISELIPESGVLNVEEIQTETSPSVPKTQDEKEDETKTVLETTYQPDHEDVADIIARYIISNQTFPDENKEDIQKDVEETDILPAAVVEEASIGKINTTKLESESEKSQLKEHETEKIAHETVVQNVQEIQNTSTSPSIGESDAIGSGNSYDVEETKSSSSVTEPKEQAVEDIHVVLGDDMNESDQETREAPKKIVKEINQDAGEVGKEEDSAIQHTEVENIEETGFVIVPEAKDQSFEEARDTKTITAAKTPNIVEAEEDGTKVLEQIYGENYTGVEASVDGRTQATGTVPGTVFGPNDQGVGEIISKDINPKEIVQNESKSQQTEPCLALLKNQDQETVVEDGVIKAEDTNQTDASSNEKAIDSFEAGTTVEKSSSKSVDESKESFDLDFEKIEKPLHTDSENIHVSEEDPTPKGTDIIDEQLEKSVASMRECESETRIENTTEAAQAIHEITSKESLTEEPEKAEAGNTLGEPKTADNSNAETPKQVSVGTKSANAVYAEEEKNEKYVEDKPITEIEGKEYKNLATESTRSIEEVKSIQVTFGTPEDKLGEYNEKDETAITNINDLENRVEKEKFENESHVPALEKNETKGSVGITEQEPTANVAEDFPSSKTTTDEELAIKDEILVDEKQRGFILDPASIISSTEEKVEKLVMLPTTNNQDALGDVTEPSEVIKEPQEEEKISLSLSQSKIAKKEYLNEEKGNMNADKDFQVIQEAKHGEEIPEAIEKMTANDPAEVSSSEILHKPADQTKQITEEPKTESEEKGLVEEEKTDEEEENEHKRADSGSDAPVMVEASRDIDVKTPTKKSHNILSGVGSKVKHSIAKVKKAITGKSSNQKSSSPKEDKKTEAVPLL